MKQKLLLKNNWSVGDIVMLTAAVRDLHRSYPGKFLTGVRTTCMELWENNPYLTQFDEDETEVKIIQCDAPLINQCNHLPYHFIHAFRKFLNKKLGLQIQPAAFHGDIHISRREKSWYSQVQELTGRKIPFWIVAAGGKYDFTIKWWDIKRYQEVVDYFYGKIQFVQVGAFDCYHPRLNRVIDLRGKTDLRQLVRLVYHSQGVLCGVTSLMHLAAAIETTPGMPKNRPCVVVAGGREPTHWEAYPHHQFVHVAGTLKCCPQGGCWKARTRPLGDGNSNDHKNRLCADLSNHLPRCMDMISAGDIIQRIQLYFSGGAIPYLKPHEMRAAERAIAATRLNQYDRAPLSRASARPLLERALATLPQFQPSYFGRGVVICGGGPKYFPNAWVAIRMLRKLGCKLPIQLWHLGEKELNQEMALLLSALEVECVDASKVRTQEPARILTWREIRHYALRHTRFKEVLLLDADVVPLRDPEFLFSNRDFQRTGIVLWPEGKTKKRRNQWSALGLGDPAHPSFAAAVILVDKEKAWKALCLSQWLNEHSDYFHTLFGSSKEFLPFALARLNHPFFSFPCSPLQIAGTQVFPDLDGTPLFQHRWQRKWQLCDPNPRLKGFLDEETCLKFLSELREQWKGYRPSSSLRLNPVQDATLEKSIPAGKAPVRLTLVTLYDDKMAAVGQITSPVLEQYARTHGYGFVCYRSRLDQARHASWNKILVLKEVLLKGQSDWVMWVDADALVMNFQKPAHALISSGVNAIFASDFNGLSCGIFLLRNCPWTMQLLETAGFLGDVNYDPDGFGVKWEQNTLKHLFGHFGDFEHQVKILPPRVMNSGLGQFQKGDFILHLGAMTNEDRLQVFQEKVKEIIPAKSPSRLKRFPRIQKRSCHPCVVTVASQPAKHYPMFLKSCQRNSIQPVILGKGRSYPNHGAKIRLTKAFLENGGGRFSHIIFCDAYDLVLATSVEEIMERFFQMGSPIIFSAETACSPHPHKHVYYPPTSSRYKYLNSGFFVAETRSLRAIFRKAGPWLKSVKDDQEFFTDLFLDQKAPITLDYESTLCQSMYGAEKDLIYDPARKKIINKFTSEAPCVFHGSGNADMSQVFNWLGLNKSPRS